MHQPTGKADFGHRPFISPFPIYLLKEQGIVSVMFTLLPPMIPPVEKNGSSKLPGKEFAFRALTEPRGVIRILLRDGLRGVSNRILSLAIILKDPALSRVGSVSKNCLGVGMMGSLLSGTSRRRIEKRCHGEVTEATRKFYFFIRSMVMLT